MKENKSMNQFDMGEKSGMINLMAILDISALKGKSI